MSESPPLESVASTKSVLREGVGAAKAGDSVRAKELIRQVVAADPRNETAWMWLSNLSRDPAETLVAVRTVLDINPANEKAKAALPVALTRAGIAAAQKGETRTARPLLDEALLHDPTNEAAWLWSASVAQTPDQAVLCLERLLALNPDHEAAREGLARYAPPAPPRPAAPPAVRTVFVVDGSVTIRKLLASALGDAGYAVAAVPDAGQAIDALCAETPAAVVVEADLLGENGFQLCGRFRKAGVPVVMAGRGGFVRRLRARWAGAAAYLPKPLDPAHVVAAVAAVARR